MEADWLLGIKSLVSLFSFLLVQLFVHYILLIRRKKKESRIPRLLLSGGSTLVGLGVVKTENTNDNIKELPMENMLVIELF